MKWQKTSKKKCFSTPDDREMFDLDMSGETIVYCSDYLSR